MAYLGCQLASLSESSHLGRRYLLGSNAFPVEVLTDLSLVFFQAFITAHTRPLFSDYQCIIFLGNALKIGNNGLNLAFQNKNIFSNFVYLGLNNVNLTVLSFEMRIDSNFSSKSLTNPIKISCDTLVSIRS